MAADAKGMGAEDAARDSEGLAEAGATKPRPGDCIHLGVVLERTDARGVSCACAGRWLHRCDLHGSCRVNDRRDSHRSCQTCDDYEAEGAEGAG